MYLIKFPLIVASLFLISCTGQPSNQEEIEQQIATGNWRMEMDMNGNILPFTFNISEDSGRYSLTIFNADEQILVEEVSLKNDSLIASLPVFDSKFFLAIENAESMSGVWVNYYKGPDYKIPLSATKGDMPRFLSTNNDGIDIEGKYEVAFGTEVDGQSKAIGIFEQKGDRLFGTFATETGDYRYLEGTTDGDSIYLSTFDGSHAFLFEAVKKDSLIEGVFYSGTHYSEKWVAQLNEDVILRDPDSLTFLKEGYDRFGFILPDVGGNMVSLEDERFQNKVVVVQIMGSWCPNCLDETNYLASLYDQYHNQGLEVVALAFERTKNKEKALENVARLQERTNAAYTFLLGGATRDEKASDALPMLNHIMSYPTAIFIDKMGEVRRIHTGFYGPSTGEYYDEFVEETESLVKELLQEQS